MLMLPELLLAVQCKPTEGELLISETEHCQLPSVGPSEHCRLAKIVSGLADKVGAAVTVSVA